MLPLAGGVRASSFWRLLAEGVDAMREVPPERWDVDAWYDPDPETPGKMTTRYGGFVTGSTASTRSSSASRRAKRSAWIRSSGCCWRSSWEALEHAGQAPDRLSGQPTGVFVGIGRNDYAHQCSCGEPASSTPTPAPATAVSFAAGRLSYVLGCRGPSMAVDTACSSSLVAVHLACQSLRWASATWRWPAACTLISRRRSRVIFR